MVTENHLVLGSRYSTEDVFPKPGTLVSTPGALLYSFVDSLYTSLEIYGVVYVNGQRSCNGNLEADSVCINHGVNGIFKGLEKLHSRKHVTMITRELGSLLLC